MKLKNWNWYILTTIVVVLSFWTWVLIALNVD